MQTSNSGSGGEFTAQLKSWWASAPLFVKLTTWAMYVIYLLSWFIPFINVALPVVPAYIIFAFEWYLPFGFFFGAFYAGNILSLLITSFVYLSQAATREKQIGTLRDMVNFFFKNLEIIVLDTAFSFIIYLLLTPSSLLFPFYGLWPIFFTYLTERCLADPEGVSGIFGLPIKIKNKYYPIILLLIFCLLSQTIVITYFVGALVGWLHHSYLDKYYLEFLNLHRINSWEQSRFTACLRMQRDYVSVGSATGVVAQPTQQPPVSHNVNEPPRQNVIPFTGKAVTIGSNVVTLNPNINRGQQNTYSELLDDSGDIERQGH